MTGYRLSQQAQGHYHSSWWQIAADSRQGADRTTDRIYASCNHLGTIRVSGEPWPGRPPGLRYYPVPGTRYLIVFVPDTDPVDILALVDGSRNLGDVSLG